MGSNIKYLILSFLLVVSVFFLLALQVREEERGLGAVNYAAYVDSYEKLQEHKTAFREVVDCFDVKVTNGRTSTFEVIDLSRGLERTLNVPAMYFGSIPMHSDDVLLSRLAKAPM
ncbi:MAG: hypothetical protein HC896_01455 [Bacteroidales bacterium]|nr:hypothetical protein [Bacteroidales bacterium]